MRFSTEKTINIECVIPDLSHPQPRGLATRQLDGLVIHTRHLLLVTLCDTRRPPPREQSAVPPPPPPPPTCPTSQTASCSQG
uniref:Uncharacterized protein n=1 Tax=Mesocestoides corti TaxID=53468 RepID=A0A5K3F325_MESCO